MFLRAITSALLHPPSPSSPPPASRRIRIIAHSLRRSIRRLQRGSARFVPAALFRVPLGVRTNDFRFQKRYSCCCPAAPAAACVVFGFHSIILYLCLNVAHRGLDWPLGRFPGFGHRCAAFQVLEFQEFHLLFQPFFSLFHDCSLLRETFRGLHLISY